MKKIYFAILLAFTGISAHGQQQPQYTQYIFNQLLINPAVSGIENYVDVKAGYRSQWTGLQGAPVTTCFSITAPIGRIDAQGDALQVPADGGNLRPYSESYRAADPHHGIGLTVVNDKAGPITQSNINASYAYHLGLSPDLNLAVGVSGGISLYSLDQNAVVLEDGSAIDPAIGNNNQVRPNVNAGIWGYSGSYFFGVSVQQLLSQTISFSSNPIYNEGKTVPHFYITGGYRFYLSDDVTLMPSVMYKIIKPASNTVDVNLKMAFREHFWVGASYRQNDAVAGMMGFTINSFLSFGYSYDYTTSNLNSVSNGTHEIFLGLHLGNNGNSGRGRVF